MAGRPGKRLIPVNDRGYVIGEDHHRAKLTDSDIDLILALVDGGMAHRLVAEKFDVSRRTVSYIVDGRRRGQTPADWRKAHKADGKS